jgi:translation elongation factor EF-1beta
LASKTDPAEEGVVTETPEVKAAEVNNKEKEDTESTVIGKREIGFGLILLALILLISYTIFENKEKINEAYQRISRRN